MNGRKQVKFDDKEGRSGPSTPLDIYSEVTESTVSDSYLSSVNLGLGNYSKSEMWQQVDTYANGLFAEAGFKRLLLERAIEQAKTELGHQGWEYTDEDGRTTTYQGWHGISDSTREEHDSRRKFVRERGQEIWNQLPDDQQEKAVNTFCRVSGGWTPGFLRMMEMRHEASRSKDSRLLDNFFGRIRKVISRDEKPKQGGLLGFRGGGSDE